MNKLQTGLLIWALGISVSSGPDQNYWYLEEQRARLFDTLNTPEQVDPTAESTAKSKEEITDEVLIHTDSIAKFQNTPFAVKGRGKMIGSNLGNVLGYGQAEKIMRERNSYPSPMQFQAIQKYDDLETLSFPLIYPDLKEVFPNQWEAFLENEDFLKYKDENADHMLVVTKVEDWKHALAYYEDWALKLATYVSIGLPYRKTVSGAFDLQHDMIFRRSRKYDNAPMPYALHITWGFFLHQGRSDGKPRSHGCIRVPGLYQKWLYEHLPRWKKVDGTWERQSTRIILDKLYN